jgi:Cytochrome c7 and related cytochrome c
MRAACAIAVVVVVVALGVLAPAGAEPARAAPPPSLAMRPKPSVHDGFVDDMDCAACHTAAGWQLAATAGASGFDHDRTGFALRGAHVQTRCTGCHTGQAKPVTSCDGCHRDPHRGRNDGTCAECHTPTAWTDTNALEQHRRTRMPLTGRHAVLDCTACHRRTGERAFSDVPADCYACHRPEYQARTLHPVHDGSTGSAAFSRDCGQCHRTAAWTPAITDPTMLGTVARTVDHEVRFALATGSHRAVACAACHADPRRAQLVRCDGCHGDAALRAQHRAPVARSAMACLGCHPRGSAR